MEYTYNFYTVQGERKDYSVQCMSANTVAGCDFLCGGSRTEITKQGTIGPYDAAWVETHWQRSSPAPMRRRSGPRSCSCCTTGKSSASSLSAPAGTMRNGSREHLEIRGDVC